MNSRRAGTWLLLLAGCAAVRPAVPITSGPSARVPSSVAPTASQRSRQPGEAEKSDPIARQLLAAHNAQRKEENLEPFTLDPKLSRAALSHAEAMARTGKLEHEGPEDGSTFAERIDRADYHHRTAAENIAEGARNVAEVMEDWMNSPGHKRNILGDFEQMGAARAKDGEGRWFWAVEFATPWPTVDATSAPAEVLRLLNERRAKDALDPLREDPDLLEIAEAMAGDLAKHGRAEGFNSSAAFDRLKSYKVRFRQATVSISVGHASAAELVEALSAKSDANASILGDFSRIGVGTAATKDMVPCWFLLLAR